MAEERVNLLRVDDRPDNLLALETVLLPLGETIIKAGSGEAALREMLHHDFAVILLDANMPGMDGFEVARYLRSRPSTASTPIIFITGNDPDRLRVASGYAAGAVDYIHKPFDPEILRSKVRVFTNLLRKTLKIEHQARELQERIARQLELLDQNRQLEQRLAERATAAERRTELLRVMAAELTQTEQRERRRLSQVLHDHLQQILVAAMLKVGSILQAYDGDAALRGHLEELRDLLRQSLESSRSLTVELSPPVLFDGGLTEALAWLAREMEQKHGLRVDVTNELEEDPVSDNLKVLLFNAARELVFNVSKHAQVETARLRVAVEGGDLALSVEDEGRGFEAAGFQDGRVTSESFGLVSITERMEVFGGRLEIESHPGNGTRATLRIPLSAFEQRALPAAEGDPFEAVRGAARPAGALRPAGRLRVLLVDDHGLLREGLATLLHGEPDMETCGQARSGEEAIRLARELRPDVIVMDISLPGMSGTEATRRILREFPAMRVIGLSMHSRDDMAGLCLKAGVEAYLSKDEPSEKLLAAIRGAAPQAANLDSPQPAATLRQS